MESLICTVYDLWFRATPTTSVHAYSRQLTKVKGAQFASTHQTWESTASKQPQCVDKSTDGTVTYAKCLFVVLYGLYILVVFRIVVSIQGQVPYAITDAVTCGIVRRQYNDRDRN